MTMSMVRTMQLLAIWIAHMCSMCMARIRMRLGFCAGGSAAVVYAS